MVDREACLAAVHRVAKSRTWLSNWTTDPDHKFWNRTTKWRLPLKVKVAQLCPTPWTIYSPQNYPGRNTGVGSLSLLQGIFPTQGSNPGLPHSRWTLYQLSHKGSPRILEWVAYPFSRGYSWPRNQTGVSCIAGGFLTNWATITKFLANMLSR